MKDKDISRKKRTQKDYTIGFKLSIVSLVEQGDYTYKQAQKVYGIQGRSTVLVWLRKYGNLDWTNRVKRTMIRGKETPSQTIKRLEKELSDEKLKTEVLNHMIEISDKQYGTSIKKKYFTKQSDGLKKNVE